MVQTSFVILRHHLPEHAEDYVTINAALKAYGELLKMSAATETFDGFVEILCWLSCSSNLESCAKWLSDARAAPVMRKLLATITESLGIANSRDGSSSAPACLKTTFIRLTGQALVFLKAEVNLLIYSKGEGGDDGKKSLNVRRTLCETVLFLKQCSELKCFTTPQYELCFGMLKHFLLGLESGNSFLRRCLDLKGQLE